MSRIAVVSWLATVIVLWVGFAQAQPGDKATAEALFVEARKLAAEGKYAEACPKFAESQKLDPAPGTLLNLADCYEHAGQTASAWATWLEAAAAAKTRGQLERDKLARERAAALQPRLLYVTIVVPESSRVEGLSITRNGSPVREVLWGTSVPVDPGKHTVVASAPGRKSWQTEVVVKGGEPTPQVVVPGLEVEQAATAPAAPVLAPAPSAPPTAAPPPPVTAPPPSAQPYLPPPVQPQPQPDQAPAGSEQRTWGYVVGGVGLVGVAVGSYFGLSALSKNEDSMEHCRSDTLCTQEGVDLRDEALAAGNSATVAFAVGAVGLIAGAILLATAPSDAGEAAPPAAAQQLSVTATWKPDGGHVLLLGRF